MNEELPVLFQDVIARIKEKSKDYNHSDCNLYLDSPRFEDFPFEDKSYMTAISAKCEILKNIIKNGKSEYDDAYKVLVDMTCFMLFYSGYLKEYDV